MLQRRPDMMPMLKPILMPMLLRIYKSYKANEKALEKALAELTDGSREEAVAGFEEFLGAIGLGGEPSEGYEQEPEPESPNGQVATDEELDPRRLQPEPFDVEPFPG
jgi:hypothetical protein